LLFFLFARAGADEIKVGVLGFDGPVSSRQAEAIAGLFARELSGADGIVVLSREDLSSRDGDETDDAIKSAVESGRSAGVRYVLLGSIRELGRPSDIEVLSMRLPGGARATIDVRLIDVESSETRLLLSETGSSANVFPPSGAEQDDFDGFDELEARAILDAVSRLASSALGALGHERPYILSVSGGGYTIQTGARPRNAAYLVYALGLSRGAEGEIEAEKIPIAALNVKGGAKGRAAGVVSAPSKPAAILPGDRLTPISLGEARGLKFAETRPDAAPKKVAVSEDEAPEPDVEESSDGPVDSSEPAPAPKTSDAPLPDPNQSTDVNVMDTYPIYHVERDNLARQHLAAMNLYSRGEFAEALAAFGKVADAYQGNFLSAYWAGLSALELRDSRTAAAWFNRALSINPKYRPAISAKGGMK
jgi:TolA-binding protein